MFRNISPRGKVIIPRALPPAGREDELFFLEEQYIMANNKKGVQRGCAKRSDRQTRSLSKAKTHRKNKSVKQRGGDLHKMYNYNSLQVDPQRMMTMDKGTVGSQTGGKGLVQTVGKHRHSRKYYKRHGGALNYSAVENLVHQATTAPMFNNPLSIQTNTQVPARI
jgi:hypothetical protein